MYILLLLLGLWPAPTLGSDPENCLLCHRFRGLSRLDPNTNELRLFFCSAEYYAYRQGPHARVSCTGCHERSEVAIVPHQVQTRVDCAQICHITPATGVELRFSHRRVAATLDRSTHSAEKLAPLRFDPPLLRPGQSTCLYCHDEPVFGFEQGIPEGFETHSGGTRCDTCHREELPLDFTYFASHVAARMKPEWPIRRLAQVCAVCHSDPKVNAQISRHDAVASYLHSFHGKASLLGSRDTATCVDCHSSRTDNQHLMLAKTEPGAPANREQLPNTCRTIACHPGAPPEMSTAAVHLDLNPAKRTPEFYVAAMFILLTAGVMAVFFALIVLELLNTAIRRHDPDHDRLVRLARELQDQHDGRRLLRRTSPHERWQHWVLVFSFALLVITGMPIKFADASWADRTIALFGMLSVARVVHRICGVILLAVFVYHIGYLLVQLVRKVLSDRRAGRPEPLWKTILFSPMMLTPQDFMEFGQLLAYLLFLRPRRPNFGRFNFTQKFEYWAVFWGAPIMGLSGLALWSAPVVSEHLSGRTINFAFIIHSDEAYLAFIYIAAVHLFSVILAPVVFPISLGTLSGQAPPEELAEGHRRELEDIARRLNVQLPEIEHGHTTAWMRLRDRTRDVIRRSYSVALMVIYGGIAFLSLRFLVLMLVTRQTAPVEIVNIPKRLDANTFLASAGPMPGAAERPNLRPRGPLAHFHQIPQWFQRDTANTCTASGCHAPLPHGKRIEVRAFLNMHGTFLDCGVCHAPHAGEEGTPRWLALPDRKPTATPAVLRLAARLEALPGRIEPADAPALGAELQALLREARPASGDDQQLTKWLLRLETTNPRSELWQQIIGEMRSGIQMHVHGEYDAKIALFSGERRWGAPTAAQQSAADEYRRKRDKLSAAQRKADLDIVHQGIAPVGAMCTPCHAPQPTLLDTQRGRLSAVARRGAAQ